MCSSVRGRPLHQLDQAAEFLVDLTQLIGGIFIGVSKTLRRALRLIVPDQRHEIGGEKGVVAIVDLIVGQEGPQIGGQKSDLLSS
jgi:hypothetical protein